MLGEPPIKMLRYQQQYSFFDHDKIGESVRFLHLGEEGVESGLAGVLARIVSEVEATSPRFVFVDSFRAIADRAGASPSIGFAHFVQRLALRLTSWEATTFLIGEYADYETADNPVFTVADGVIWLKQSVERSSVVRRAQVLKSRGQKQIPGLHTFRMTDDGVRIYPRMQAVPTKPSVRDLKVRRTTGVAGLDELMGGGVPAGFTVMVVGPSGSGKSLLTTQFVLEGIEHGEPGVIAVFEKRPEEYLEILPNGQRVAEFVAERKLRMMYLRPLDLSVEETMEQLREHVVAIGAKRVAIDSLSGFELALAPAYREEFRESLYRMLGTLTELGVTVMMAAELVESFTELRLSPHGISFLADAIVLQRYVESRGRITRAMAVLKMCGCAHSTDLCAYEIDDQGITMGETLGSYGQVLTGVPLLGSGTERGDTGTKGRNAVTATETKKTKKPVRPASTPRPKKRARS